MLGLLNCVAAILLGIVNYSGGKDLVEESHREKEKGSRNMQASSKTFNGTCWRRIATSPKFIAVKLLSRPS